ncbi:MAG: sel1 repeat family protein [Rhodanobacter sp.]
MLATTAAMVCAGQPYGTANAQTVAPGTAAATVQQPVPPPRSNATIKRILATMDEASTDGHPDLFGQFAGMQRLFEGKYAGAMKYFKIGAYYADKLSQISIGMIYLHGRGVAKDPATACAWITLAAERGYPSYVAARDQVCKLLSPAQHDRAMAVLDTLRPEYGDAVAMQRMKLQLIMARNSLTGSHLGHDSGVRTMALDTSHPVNCAGYRLNLGGVEVPPRGCGTYNPDLWDSKKYFAARDAQWYGTVTVGRLTKVNPPVSDTDQKKSDDGH